MRDRSKRRGVNAVMRMVEKRVHEEAKDRLPADRLAEMESAAGSSLYLAGRYPAADWESSVGFAPSEDFHYEVIVGIAVDPPERPNIIARALVSRDADEDFCFIHWHSARSDT